MIILGIDPGSRKTGYGVIEVKGRKISYLDSGTLHFDKEKEFLDRLGNIHQSCEELIEVHRPSVIALESLIYVKSVTSLAKLAQARGAMIAAFSKTHHQLIFEYSPNLIKSSVSGFGHASKESIDKSLDLILGKRKYKTNDESDALAVAICHFLNHKNKKQNSNLTSLMSSKNSRSLKSVFAGIK